MRVWAATLAGAFVLLTAHAQAQVMVREVEDYVFGGYRGEFHSPPSADGNPKHAVIVSWKNFPGRRFVFSHEGSYCPWFELSDGSGLSFQFFEGNDGWAELFNQFGRMEKNSFVEIVDHGPEQVHVRWTYFGVNQDTGQRAYHATEDFYCLANGLVLRRQGYQTLMPHDPHGYAREPIEMIAMCPVGRLWKDVLETDPTTGERHALAAIDPFSRKRYDVYWQPKRGTLWEATPRRKGCNWKDIDDSPGVALLVPLRAGGVFCVFGTASGYDAKLTRVKEHSHKDTGGIGWVSSSWDHWPIGWLNSQAHPVDADSLQKYPNHFSPAGMDLFAMPDEQVARGVYWSLCGVGGQDLEPVRRLARQWLENHPDQPEAAAMLPPLP
jgi:hypothetical protein